MKLLIVDDSAIIRSRIARLTSDSRLPALSVVGLARNGAEAISLFAQHRPRLVTMDLTLPELDGLGCIDAMCRLDGGCRILVVSALADRATALRALKLGAMGFLLKPFTDQQLIGSLQELINDD